MINQLKNSKIEAENGVVLFNARCIRRADRMEGMDIMYFVLCISIFI